MTPERWQQIEEIFQAALERPHSERPAFLVQMCKGDEELRGQVERLLQSDEEAGDFMASRAQVTVDVYETQMSDETASHRRTGQMIGRQIGAYRLEREIGRGGMGAVYLAVRADQAFQKRVAIKLIKRGMDTDFIVRRFRRERQIMASFDHPNIARLLDGGSTDDGLPYFVMEYIEGQAITRWCDDRQLTVKDRLKLFLQVCAAVQYAHQNQVIHRDLKPGNILVTEEGVPKLLDFGIARILNPALAADTMDPTLTAMRLMTPEYASPEQARGEPVSVNSDVYSLGVILYEMLTGHRPYRLRHYLSHEVARIVSEVEPDKPSIAVTRREEALAGDGRGNIQLTPALVSGQRATTPEDLQRELTGGLDDIVMLALRKNQHERYATAADLANDISCWLQGQPLVAPVYVPPEALTVADTVVTPLDPNSLAILPLKRLQSGDPTTSGNFLSVGLADALITRLSNLRHLIVRPTSSVLKYAREETDALAAGKALQVSYVLDGRILTAGERTRITVQLINVRTAAPEWAAQFDERGTDLLELQDLIAAQLTQEIARKITGKEQQQLARRGTDNPQAYEAYLRGRYHWHTYTDEGLARAITSFYDAIAIDPNFAAAYTGVADYFNWLGLTAALPPDECFQAAKEAATRAGQLDDKLAEAWASLSVATWAHDWDAAASEQLMRRSLELNPHYAQAHEWYAHLLSALGRHAEAISSMRRALEINPQAPALHAMMAFILHNARLPDEAYQYAQRARELEPDYYLALQATGWLYPHAGQAEEALASSRKAVELTERAPLALWALAHVLAVTGQHNEAQDVLREMHELAEHRFIPAYFFARIHAALGETDQAFACLEQSFAQYESWALETPVDPQLDPLRADPRFARLLARLRPRPQGATARFAAPTQSLTTSEQTETEPRSDDNSALNNAQTLPAPPGITRRRERQLLFPALAVALIALAVLSYFLVRGLRNNSANKVATESLVPGVKSIAVLPFRTDSASEAERSIGVGLADMLGSRLSMLRQLSVRPVSATRRYLETEITPQQAAAEQEVDYVISGRVRRAGKTLRFQAEMFGVKEDSVLLSADLEGDENRLADVQKALAERVLRELKFELTGSDLLQLTSRSTENSEAWQLYLVGRYHFGKRSVPGLQEAIKYYQQALKLDDRFAQAWAGVADCYSLLNLYALPPPREAMEKARENALKALALDDHLAEPHASLAYVRFWYDRDRAGAERELQRALVLNPGYVTAHHWYALMLSAIGRFDAAKTEIRTAQQLDPRSAILKSAAAMVWFYARQYDEALDLSRQALELDPGLVPAHKVQRWIYQALGRYDEALAAYQREKSFSGDTGNEWPAILAQVQAIGGLSTEARENLRRAIGASGTPRNPEFLSYEIALAYALLGDHDQAFMWLARADADRLHSYNFIATDPRLDPLRADARYNAILKKAGWQN